MFVYLFKGSIISTTLATGHHHDQHSFNAMQSCRPREAGNLEKNGICWLLFQGVMVRKTEGPQAYFCYSGRPARAEWPTFLPSWF